MCADGTPAVGGVGPDLQNAYIRDGVVVRDQDADDLLQFVQRLPDKIVVESCAQVVGVEVVEVDDDAGAKGERLGPLPRSIRLTMLDPTTQRVLRCMRNRSHRGPVGAVRHRVLDRGAGLEFRFRGQQGSCHGLTIRK